MGDSAPNDARILFVDDEPQARKYFEKAYARDFHISTAADAEQAYRILETEAESIGVIVTDQRMPRESGVTLLKHVRQHHPWIVRILTTAYSDIDSAIDAVNEGAVFRYVNKPWDIHELRGILYRAMDMHQLQRERDALLQEKLATMQHLLLVDRLRSFMVLAATLSGRIAHPYHGLNTFLELRRHAPLHIEAEVQGIEPDGWTVVMQQSRALLQAADEVAERLAPTNLETRQPTSLLDAAQHAANERRQNLTFKLESHAPRLEVNADPAMIGQAIADLGEVLLALAGAEDTAPVTVTIEPLETVHQTPGIRIELAVTQPQTTDPAANRAPATVTTAASTRTASSMQIQHRTTLEARLLAACLGASHHRGRVTVSPPGAAIELPLVPARAELPPLPPHWLEDTLDALADPP